MKTVKYKMNDLMKLNKYELINIILDETRDEKVLDMETQIAVKSYDNNRGGYRSAGGHAYTRCKIFISFRNEQTLTIKTKYYLTNGDEDDSMEDLVEEELLSSRDLIGIRTHGLHRWAVETFDLKTELEHNRDYPFYS